jgi:hypothetical protein
MLTACNLHPFVSTEWTQFKVNGLHLKYIRVTPLCFYYACMTHPLVPLCVCVAIIPRDPFGGVIHLIPMNIRLTSPLHTTHVRSFPLFSQIFAIFVHFLSGAMTMDGANPEILLVHFCPFCIRYVSIGQWGRPLDT